MPTSEKVALVTGASRGIGRSISVRLAQTGYKVALLARDKKGLEETAKQCGSGRGILLIQCDVSNSKEWKPAIEKVVEKWGGLQVLVNNAGMHESGDADSWDRTLDVNLRATMGFTRLALPYLEKGGGGAVVNIASIAGITGMAGSAAYCASKHGVMGFTRALFEDVRDKNIKVSAICPGFVATDLTKSPKLDSTKMVQPEDIAEAVLFVVNFPSTGCPTEIVIRPQHSPRK